MKHYFELSVHQLVDFVLRKGDIDDRLFNTETLTEGTKVHQFYQSKQNENYFSEVFIEGTIIYKDYVFVLNGRMDGLIINKNSVCIDEIKSTNGDLNEFYEKNKAWHLGQAECYAYLYCLKNNLNDISVRLTYISQKDKKKVETKEFKYDFLTLKHNINSYLEDYISFVFLQEKLMKERNESLKNFEFPFEHYRKGQEELVNYTSDVIKEGKTVFVEASTGIGKTISFLYPSLRYLQQGKIDKFFYLTPKNSGFIPVLDTFYMMLNKGAKIKVASILSKEKMCLSTERKCNPDKCPFAKEYYSKIGDIIKLNLIKYDVFTSDVLKEIAWENMVCPYELSLDISLYCNYILCDYNYVFHPTARLKRYFEAPDVDYKKFLYIDEAHNLISRARDMYSSTLSYGDFKEVRKILNKENNKRLKNIVSKINSHFKNIKNFVFEDKDGNEVKDLVLQTIDHEIINDLKKFTEIYKDYTNNHTNFFSEECDNYSKEIYKFLRIYELVNTNFSIYVHKINEDDLYIKIYCLDASPFINETVFSCNGSIFFSGTISPIDYYMHSILGINNLDFKRIESPFDKNNLNLLINTNTSLMYSDRLDTIDKIEEYINEFIKNKVGNYLVFAPSFEYLKLLKDRFISSRQIKYVFQKQDMTMNDKYSFLDYFVENPKKTTVGFVVIGGSFSEGIDLINDRLIGVIVLGVGMPNYNFENNLLRDYYSSLKLDGFNYAYVYPGMNRVMQAVGRLIRTENDKGSALLIDTRYARNTYKNLFKSDWDEYKKVYSVQDLSNYLNNFNKN
ncbi:MAG: ATP-dependent DNA helicase [Bacilli bacterium]|nr:ATP-dependent DNA helicase [Bacilli bacterium]